jgi:hypothetical protein
VNQLEVDSIAKKGFWDYIGVAVSGICVLHCMLIPLVLLAFPVATSYFFLDGPWFHKLIFLAVLLVASIAFYYGYKVHHSREPLVYMSIGLLLVTLGTFMHDFVIDHFWPSVVVMAGSVSLIRAHLLNHSHRHRAENATHCRSCQ